MSRIAKYSLSLLAGVSAMAATFRDCAEGPIDKETRVLYQYHNLLSSRPNNTPAFNPDDRIGKHWLIEDPASGKKAFVYYYDCDKNKLETFLGAKFDKLTRNDRGMESDTCSHYNDKAPNTWLQALSKTVGGVPVLLSTFRIPNDQSLIDLPFLPSYLNLLSERESVLISKRHEEGHAMDYLLDRKPADIKNYSDVWAEAAADSYMILAVTRDTGSLYTASVWANYRLAASVSFFKTDSGNVMGAGSTKYFNPLAFKAALKMAQEMLDNGNLSTASDIELAKKARNLTHDNILSKDQMTVFDDAVDTMLERKIVVSPEESIEKLKKLGAFSDIPQREEIIEQMKNAVGFFRYAAKFSPQNVSAPAPQTAP